MQALRAKYAPRDDQNDETEIVYVSGKQAEEVGFEKIARQQAQLQDLRVVILDRMLIAQQLLEPEQNLFEICPNITELDLGSNLFESFQEIVYICQQLPGLQRLTLDGNRFRMNAASLENSKKTIVPMFDSLIHLSVSRTLLDWQTVGAISLDCPNLQWLSAAENELSTLPDARMSTKLTSLNLEGNEIEILAEALPALALPSLRSLSLKRNNITSTFRREGDQISWSSRPLSIALQELDLSYNSTSDWILINDIPHLLPNLLHLRVTGNPLYINLRSAEGKALMAEDGYMLTIARLPQVETLNYSKITEKERLNAETYYLGQIAVELGKMTEDEADVILQHHPRYRALCEEYGEPAIIRKPKANEVDPNSLTARLITFTFRYGKDVWKTEIPKSFNIYAVLGVVGKHFGLAPLTLRLTWETGERDPAHGAAYQGPEWWDSSDEEDTTAVSGDWVEREVELVPGTRAVGTYVEGKEATVRVYPSRTTERRP